MNPYEDNLRRLIREHIKSERVSLSKVAEAVGLSYPTLNGFMTGTGSARDSTVDKIETYFARIQPNGDERHMNTSTANGASTPMTRTTAPPDLRGFTLCEPVVQINGAFGAKVNFEAKGNSVKVKLLATVRRYLGVDGGSRMYVYLSGDGRRLAFAVAPDTDTKRTVRVNADGNLAVSWLRPTLLAAGWQTGALPVIPMEGNGQTVVIDLDAAA